MQRGAASDLARGEASPRCFNDEDGRLTVSSNAYIEIAYLDDGRVVESQCLGVAKFIGAGLAKPRTEKDAEVFMAWVDSLSDDERAAVVSEAEAMRAKHPPKRAEPEPVDDAEASGPELVEDEPEADSDVDEPEPDPVTTDDDPKDGWPPGVTVDQKGAYFALKGSDGKPIESDAPSGKFMGKDTAQEAAWTYENGLTTGE